MAKTFHQGNAIVAGYPWSMRLRIDTSGGGPTFPVGVGFIADVKRNIQDTETLAELSTAAGSLVRFDDYAMDIIIPPEMSADWRAGRVWIDFARADQTAYLGIMAAIPVMEPVTRRRP